MDIKPGQVEIVLACFIRRLVRVFGHVTSLLLMLFNAFSLLLIKHSLITFIMRTLTSTSFEDLDASLTLST